MRHRPHKHHKIGRQELLLAQLILLIAIGLQLISRQIGSDVLPGSQYMIMGVEFALIIIIGLTVNRRKAHMWGLYHFMSVLFLGIVSLANLSSLVFVLHSLIVNHALLSGAQLLVSAVAIFLTNIIVYALWYWEIDSPGLTRTLWSKHDKDFQFTQYDMKTDYPDWQPQFGDYLYLSITNAINFAPADSRPVSLQAKTLMASQALISVFTLALLIARSVNILGT